MRLGLLMAGEGVGALGAIGAIKSLERAGVSVHAVCGMGAGAYPTALWACGMDAQAMLGCAQTLHTQGARLIDRDRLGLLLGRSSALIKGKRVARLLLEQTQGMALRECTRNAAFLCMAIPARRTVAFSAQSPEGTDMVWTSHAPVWFAARAALGAPPEIRAASFVGVPVCAHCDAREGIRALYALGATHIAALYPVYARGVPRRMEEFPAWERIAALERTLAGVRRVRMEMPEYIDVLDFEDIPACIRAGERACAQQSFRAWEADAGTIVPFPDA